jgi:transcriptional regulator with XRE-family HTH domain
VIELKGVAIDGKKLRILRERLVLSQEELASQIGMSKNNLSEIERSGERGEPRGMQRDRFRKLAEVSQRTLEQLVEELSPEGSQARVVFSGGSESLAGALERLARSSPAEQRSTVKRVSKEDIKRLVELFAEFVNGHPLDEEKSSGRKRGGR